MIDQTNEIISRLTSTAQGLGALAAVVMILLALVVGRTLVKVLSTLVLVGIALFAVAKPGYFKDKVGSDLEKTESGMRRPPAVVVGEAPATMADALAGLPVRAAGPTTGA
jgi:hypothetical protein